jgi:hypothetical protein
VGAAQWVYAGGMFEMAFACLAGTDAQARHALLIAQSLRAFGGSLAGSPVMALVPLGSVPGAELEAGMRACGVTAVPYALAEPLNAVLLAERAAGAAQAEAEAQEIARCLVWLDSDSLIVREPIGLHIPPEARIGCRPVDLQLIGSPWEEKPDAFWEAIYEGCGVERNRIFRVSTTVEGRAVRAYFNAGCLVVRPEARLLRRWQAAILTLVGRDEFRALSGREGLFFHQAVLAGTLLSTLRQDEIAELPPTVSYPLHLHGRVPKERRPASLRDVESCRYESVFDHEDWASRVPVDEGLHAWLEARRWLARNG